MATTAAGAGAAADPVVTATGIVEGACASFNVAKEALAATNTEAAVYLNEARTCATLAATAYTTLNQLGVNANVAPQHGPNRLTEARENMSNALDNVNTVNKKAATRVSTAESNLAAAKLTLDAAQLSLQLILQVKLQMLQMQQKSMHELEVVQQQLHQQQQQYQQQQQQQQRDVADKAAVAELQKQINALSQ